MINKILVPLDGSPLSACVLPHVVAIARATGAHVTLLRVIERNRELSTSVNPADWRLSKVEAQAYLDELQTQLTDVLESAPETIVLEGPAADRIIEQAQHGNFDIITLSSHGQSGLSGWNISSVAQKVIQRAGKSILLARAYQVEPGCADGDWGSLHYHRILAPLDGSQRAESVLPMASALAKHDGAELTLAYIAARPELFQRMPLTTEDTALVEQLVERNQAQANKYLEQLRARLMPEARTRVVVNGHITAALHKLVNQEEADLVVLSAHGSSGHNQWPYGGVVSSFINYGATALLIMQDLPLHNMEATQAEAAATSQPTWRKINGLNDTDRTTNYASGAAYAYTPTF